MSRLLPVALLLLAGCDRHFDSVDDACRDGVRGDGDASESAVDIVRRISCYRKFAGIDRGNLDRRVTDAVESHAFYLSENPDQLLQGWNLEASSGVGYSGTDAFTRLAATDFLVPDGGTSAFIWEVLGYVDPDLTNAERIDLEMRDPFYRDVYLSPSWEAAGYGEFASTLYGADVQLSYMNIVLYYPSGARSGNPVAYPIDGQTNVPTTWSNPYGYDPALGGVPPLAGFPISFTCGSSSTVGGDNPLQVGVTSSVITGPSGPVEHAVLLPGLYAIGPNNSTAVLVPTAPLEPNASYTVDVSLAWIDHDRDLSLTFTTGASEADATALARQLGTLPLHRELRPLR